MLTTLMERLTSRIDMVHTAPLAIDLPTPRRVCVDSPTAVLLPRQIPSQTE